MKYAVTCFLVLMFPLSGCDMKQSLTREGQYLQSAQRAYRSGNPDEAVLYLVESIKNDPSYADAILLLIDLYPEACNRHLKKASGLIQTAIGNDWEQVIHEYQSLRFLQNQVSNLPPLKHPNKGTLVEFNYIDIDKTIQEATQHYAQEFYQKGIVLSSFYPADKLKLREAALSFKKAESILPGYRDAKKQFDTLRERAMISLGILTDQGEPEAGNIALMLADQTGEPYGYGTGNLHQGECGYKFKICGTGRGTTRRLPKNPFHRVSEQSLYHDNQLSGYHKHHHQLYHQLGNQ